MHLSLKEEGANLSSISPTADPLLPITADPNGLLEHDAPSLLYGAGQDKSEGNDVVHYEPVDVSEAENPMYAGTLLQGSGAQLDAPEQQYVTIDNPMYTEPLHQSGSQPAEDLHESFEHEVTNPLYTMRDNDNGFDGGRNNSMEANPVYSNVQPHQYEYVSVPSQTPASTGDSDRGQ